jgi:hypothetical protein
MTSRVHRMHRVTAIETLLSFNNAALERKRLLIFVPLNPMLSILCPTSEFDTSLVEEVVCCRLDVKGWAQMAKELRRCEFQFGIFLGMMKRCDFNGRREIYRKYSTLSRCWLCESHTCSMAN